MKFILQFDLYAKYYFSDLGLRNSVIDFRQIEPSHLIENMIYNELRYRGFRVDVGLVVQYVSDSEGHQSRRQLEVDFVCDHFSKRYYIQSALEMSPEEKRQQEFNSLFRINDNFKKIVIVGGMEPTHQDNNGILILNIFDFLLKPEALDL